MRKYNQYLNLRFKKLGGRCLLCHACLSIMPMRMYIYQTESELWNALYVYEYGIHMSAARFASKTQMHG